MKQCLTSLLASVRLPTEASSNQSSSANHQHIFHHNLLLSTINSHSDSSSDAQQTLCTTDMSSIKPADWQSFKQLPMGSLFKTLVFYKPHSLTPPPPQICDNMRDPCPVLNFKGAITVFATFLLWLEQIRD